MTFNSTFNDLGILTGGYRCLHDGSEVVDELEFPWTEVWGLNVLYLLTEQDSIITVREEYGYNNLEPSYMSRKKK